MGISTKNWQTSLREVATTDRSEGVMDTVVTLLSVGFLTGVVLDFKVHHSGISFAEEGFFTPEHVLFYSMFLGIVAVIGSVTYRNYRAGTDWIEAVPLGYRWGIIGLLLFALGGLGDFWWHSTFGFEQGTEGLASPSHLLLTIGAVIFLASPLRAVWYRSDDPTGFEVFPVVVSTALVFSLFALFGGWVNPLSQPRPAPAIETNAARMIGISGLHVFSLFLVGIMQALTRRFQLPFGALTVVIVIPAVVTGVVWGTLEYVPIVVLTGLVADTFVQWRRPTTAHVRTLRVFGGLIPLVFVGSYMGAVELTAGLAWSLHIWAGTIVTAGLIGVLFTYAIIPSVVTQD